MRDDEATVSVLPRDDPPGAELRGSQGHAFLRVGSRSAASIASLAERVVSRNCCLCPACRATK